MRPMHHAMALLLGSGSQDLAFRLAQVALPLVVLERTGSVGLTGLAAGAQGIPVLLSPWWARAARQWLRSGRRLAALAAFDAAALCVVPTAALVDVLSAGVLLAAGLFLGIGETLGGPGRAALLADVGDRLRPDGAITLLTWQDLLRRTGMVVGPALGAVAVTMGFSDALLWAQAATVLCAGLLAWPVPGDASASESGTAACAPTIRGALRGRPDVLVGWVLRGTNSAVWFAFTLGLAVLGVEQRRPGVLYAWGMTGYGVGSIAGTLVAVSVVRRFAASKVASTAWTMAGLAWVLMSARPSPSGAAVAAAIAGAFIVIGITAVNRAITHCAAGAERRTLLSGQAVVVNASSSAGLLLGGPVIAALGVRTTLLASGLLVSAVSLGVPALVRRSPSRRAEARVSLRSQRVNHRGADEGRREQDHDIAAGQASARC